MLVNFVCGVPIMFEDDDVDDVAADLHTSVPLHVPHWDNHLLLRSSIAEHQSISVLILINFL